MARPRGFARWEPRADTLALLSQVDEVLVEYEKFLPLTVRQVFYRLVGQYGYDKTEQAYARLCEMLVRARRAGMVAFDSRNRLAGQDVAIEFWVALTDDQVEEHGLPTAPPKKSDTRSRNWVGETCQLEAMPPELLADTIREAIRDEIDLELYREQVELEEADRDRIERGIELALEA